MGEHRNSRMFKAIAWITGVVMIGLTLVLVAAPLLPKHPGG
jgi:Mn2+/Fe2+ NRAMP family transporter